MRSIRATSPSGPSASGSAPSGTQCSSEPGTNDAGAQQVVVGRAEEGAEAMIRLREFLRGLTLAGTASLAGRGPELAGAEPPPETTRLRISRVPSTCRSPEWMAEELLRAEGFSHLQYTPTAGTVGVEQRSEEHTSELQSPCNLVCRLLLEKKKEYANANSAVYSM